MYLFLCVIKQIVENAENVRSDYMAKAGCPTKYKEEYCQDIINYFNIQPQFCMYKEEYFQNGQLKSKTPILTANQFPTFQGYADKIGVHIDTLHEWKSKHIKFSEAYMRAKQLQEKIWLVNSMSNLYNAQFAQFFGKNCLGYKDKQEVEHSGKLKLEDVL